MKLDDVSQLLAIGRDMLALLWPYYPGPIKSYTQESLKAQYLFLTVSRFCFNISKLRSNPRFVPMAVNLPVLWLLVPLDDVAKGLLTFSLRPDLAKKQSSSGTWPRPLVVARLRRSLPPTSSSIVSISALTPLLLSSPSNLFRHQGDVYESSAT